MTISRMHTRNTLNFLNQPGRGDTFARSQRHRDRETGAKMAKD